MPGTGGSENFRIPAIITLENGDLIAAADARWGTWEDGGGLDTIASVSGDGGKTWNYSYPLYFPDSKRYGGRSATTIIGPGIVEGPFCGCKSDGKYDILQNNRDRYRICDGKWRTLSCYYG